ncbi:hypothetical protein D3C86_1871170 [compost metagenome]
MLLVELDTFLSQLVDHHIVNLDQHIDFPFARRNELDRKVFVLNGFDSGLHKLDRLHKIVVEND